jgi:ubiquinone/menaquinone biosynthesis C-methylase UbiE
MAGKGMQRVASERSVQRDYYAMTANRYEEMRSAEHESNIASLTYIASFLRQFSARTVLDVGCGTGKTIAHLYTTNPEVTVYGVEPVRELLEVACTKGVTNLVHGSGLTLPFRDGSFDVVIECAVLHHVRKPEAVVSEMARVARKAIFLCDSNIFGQGGPAQRLIKLLLYKIGLWKAAKFIQTRGKGYTLSEGDGLAYSYSVYFQYHQLRKWTDKVFVIPISASPGSLRSWSSVLSAAGVLLCAVRE